VFGNREACGTYYEITCKGATSGGGNACKQNPTVKVMVVDLCPGCNKNSFDLSKEAFSKIADLDAGRINISAKR
jgi:expansin (peptidoglycan-binding protein)